MAEPTEPQTGKQVGDGVPTATATGLSDSSATKKPDALSEQTVLAADAFVGRVLSHYRLEERLGSGGMGLLYRATDLKLGRAVAIKLLARHLVSDEAAKARFVREARAASALDHPNIANIYEIGEADGELFIAMALYEGETLKRRLEKGRLAVDEALGILRQVLLGLEAAHGAGIVHRDIKPANILVTSIGTVKILDFGLAKLVSDSQAQTMTELGKALGTVLYMSPEQLRGQTVDSRSDLWSFGVFAYELLAGASPFQTDSSAATVARILDDEAPSLAAVPGVPDWLAQLVSELLRKNPAERPQTASEVLRRLGGSDPGRSLPLKPRPGAESSGPLTSAPAEVEPSYLANWFAELKRRRVFRALVGYGIAAFAVLQIIEPIMHGAHWPESVLSYVVAGLAAGFPIVVALAWIFDVKAGRIERTASAPTATGLRGVALALVLAAIGVLAAVPGLFYYFVLRGHGRGASGGNSASGVNVATIAVLPFANLSGSEENAYFAQGFHDELLRQMGRIGDLRVISRTSVMQYKDGARNLREIAEALGVSSIVEGSVQRAGNRVRVEARLIDARKDVQIWSDRYDRAVSDVFGIQTAVAEEIASALHARLSSAQKAQVERKPTESTDAYDLYLRAVGYQNRPGEHRENLAIAEQLYRQALRADPSFALAHARLAYVKLFTYWFVAGTPDTAAEEARSEAEEALHLQADLPEGHFAMGLYYYWGWRDYSHAIDEFETARAGLPSEAINFMGAVLRRQGKFDDAIRCQREALRLEPRQLDLFTEAGISLLFTRRYAEADQLLERALTIAPDFSEAIAMRALLYEVWKGQSDMARSVLWEARAQLDSRRPSGEQDWVFNLLFEHNAAETLPYLDSLRSESITSSSAVYPKSFLYAVAHGAQNDARARKEYEAAVQWLESQAIPERRGPDPGGSRQRTVLARAYAGLGRKEDALREATRAVESLPMSKDAYYGCYVETYRAQIEARVGDADSAIAHVRELLSVPCLLSPGLLRIDPRWAPLRQDPRFRKLAELENE